jgi:septal ring factor EnvC (AmiA/AmiB activator)
MAMSDSSHAAKSLRDKLGGHTEDRLGRALSDLLDNPLLSGAIGRAFDAREKAAQAQEVAMGALNLPSAADIERLTRRLRSVSQRLEGIEDGVGRLDRALAPSASDRSDIDQRLSAIEAQLAALLRRLDEAPADNKPARARPKAASARKSKRA